MDIKWFVTQIFQRYRFRRENEMIAKKRKRKRKKKCMDKVRKDKICLSLVIGKDYLHH